MNPQDPLAQLHPLRDPALIGWWPLAPGWWLLLVLVILALGGLAWYLLRRYRAGAYRRRALQNLQAINHSFQLDSDHSNYVARTNALLKSVALSAYKHHTLAAANGQQWLDFLNSSAGETLFDAEFAEAAYQKQAPQLSPERLYTAASTWIQKHQVTQ